ncbi:MAG: DUF2330 domain-containing protein [Planctomycetes bacterium]|nr:DUF2330 domain-containing protein [Planctomycetota bacterium]
MLLLHCAGSVALADGKFMSRLEVADDPSIHAQRAIIAFRDGIETLVVQSDVDGQGAGYGWLLPLPANPVSISACSPNAIRMMMSATSPRVASADRLHPAVCTVLLLLVVLACFDHLRSKGPKTTGVSIVRVLLGVTFVLVMAVMLVSSMGDSSTLTTTGDVEILQRTRAGVYDVAVIKAKSAANVSDWANSNGFRYPQSANDVVGQYIADGWCFLAAKVARESEGPITHHPLKIEFPTKVPVYPMRLTGVGQDHLALDLCVIASKRAEIRSMRTWFCDSYRRDAPSSRFDAFRARTPKIYKSSLVRFVRIGHPDVSPMMWPGCVVTRLHGELGPDEMSEDLLLGWQATKPTRKTVYSYWGAITRSASIAILVLAGLLVGRTFSAARMGWSFSHLMRRSGYLVLAASVLVGGICFAVVEVVPTNESFAGLGARFAGERAHQRILNQLVENPPHTPFPEAYRFRLQAFRSGKFLERIKGTGQSGDYDIERDGEGWRLTVVDAAGVFMTVPISSNGVPVLAADTR